MSSQRPIIRLRDVGVGYEGVVALEHVTLDIFSNDFVGIIGPNGGGKSSLVKAIMGVTPHTGDIDFDQSIMHGGKPHIGYMPQITTFDKAFPISVGEVVMSGLQAERGVLLGYGKSERRRVDEILERVRLTELKKRSIGAYLANHCDWQL